MRCPPGSAARFSLKSHSDGADLAAIRRGVDDSRVRRAPRGCDFKFDTASGGLFTQNDEFGTKSDGFSTQNDEFHTLNVHDARPVVTM